MQNATVIELIRENRYHFLAASLLMAVLYSGIVAEMAGQWMEDANYSHGFLIPLISGYFVYEKRREISKLSADPSNWGILLVLFSLLLLAVGKTAIEYFSMRISLVFLIAGMILYLFGPPLFTATLLPVSFLAFMVPLPYIVYDGISFPLRMLVARFSVWSLQHLGIAVLREGNIIVLPNITLEIADACSGLRSLISLLAIGVAIAFLFNLPTIKRVILILMILPIAMATNALRVIITGILANRFGASAATGFFHEFAGLTVFALALAMMLGLLMAMKRSGQ